MRERRWEPSTLPGPGTHTLPASCVPLLKSAALTVFSFSDRLSRFSGDTLSCCWSVMVASGTRAESMASEGSGRGDGDSGGAARTRSTGERQTLHLLKGPRRGRARASHWLEHAPGAGVAPSSLPHKDLHGVCADPGARGRSGARNRLGWREAQLWASTRVGGRGALSPRWVPRLGETLPASGRIACTVFASLLWGCGESS